MKFNIFSLLLILFVVGCAGKAPISPVSKTDNGMEYVSVPQPWVKSDATYCVMIESDSVVPLKLTMWEGNLFLFTDGNVDGIYEVGLGVFPCPPNQVYGTHTEVNPYVGGLYGVTLSQGDGAVTVHIYRNGVEVLKQSGDAKIGFTVRIAVQ